METWKTIYTVVRERKEFNIKKKKSKKSKIKKEFMNWPHFYRSRTQEFRDLMQYVISPFLDCEERYDMKTVNKLFYRIFKKYWRLEFRPKSYYVGEVIPRTKSNCKRWQFYGYPSIPHGEGKMTYLNGSMYQGEWKDAYKHGQGKMIYRNGSIYQGEFDKGKAHGEGKMVWSIGDVYEGEWKHGERHGQGKMTYLNGSMYQGEWKDGSKHGQGKMIYQNGSIYNGKWKCGKHFTNL